MFESLPVIYKILIILILSGCVLIGYASLFYLIRMILNIKDGTKRRDYLYNRFNVIFLPSLLTNKGIEARTRALFWGKIFLSIIVLIICVVFIINLAKGSRFNF